MMVKKSETWMFLFFIWFIGGILLIPLYIYYNRPYLITVLIVIILWGIIILIFRNIYSQCADIEKWVYDRLQFEWKLIENPLSAFPTHISLVSLLAATISTLVYGLLILALFLAFYLVAFLWIECGGDISKFGESVNNYMSVILVFIFMTQAWIFYQQYRHMTKPFFKTTLLWALSKSNSDTDCCILLKNGGTAPIFNISCHISKVLLKDGWGYKGHKRVKYSEVSKDFLPRLDGGSEKEIFEKPTEEFKEMILVVDISAKTLDGYSTRLLFYKACKDMDFRLVGVIRT